MVDLCLRTAALADPENVAWRSIPSAAQPPEAVAARAARDRCYGHYLEPLRALVGGRPLVVAPAAAPKAPGAVEGVPLAAAEAKAAKEAMYKV